VTRGIKANDYNASYTEGVFEVIAREEIYEIRELNSGTAFFIDKGAFHDNKGRKEGTKTDQRHDWGHKGSGVRDRASDDSSNKDDDRVQSSKRIWYAGEQIRERPNGDRGLQRTVVKSAHRAREVQESVLGEGETDRTSELAEGTDLLLLQ